MEGHKLTNLSNDGFGDLEHRPCHVELPCQIPAAGPESVNMYLGGYAVTYPAATVISRNVK